MKLQKLSIAFGAILLASAAQAGPIFAPVAATIDAGGPGFGNIADTFNENGLFTTYVPNVTDFDAYIATNPMHTDIFSGFEWFSNSGTTSAQVTYDFGSVRSFDKLALWNEESSGIGQLDLITSVDGVTFTALATVFPTDNPLANYGADVFAFGLTSARYVRFGMSGCPQPNPGSFQGCAIGEVAFRGAAPEPASWAMMVAGFGAVGGALRSRRKSMVSFA
jgi:hypothetical protein